MHAASLRLFLIRHGESEWSLSVQHTGHTDIALTAHDEELARALGPSLWAVRFDHVLTSPTHRAQRTCALAGLGGAAEMEPDLAEWDYGEYEGQTSADIRQKRPGWNVFRDGCPGGETVEEVALRADRLITRLATLSGNMALFSNGQFGCSLAARWIGTAVIEGQHLMLGTGSIGVLGYNPAYPELRAIAHWNFSPNSPLG